MASAPGKINSASGVAEGGTFRHQCAVRAWKSLALAALVAGSALVAAALWTRAFPIAAVDFALSSTQVSARMAAFLEEMGARPGEAWSAVTFGESSDEKNFIELEYGTRRLEQLERAGLAVWYWTGRWFRPGVNEEHSVWLNPRGDLVGYWRTVDDAEKIPSLSQNAARTLATDFLRARVGHHPSGRLTSVGESFERRPNRVDYTFTWERPDLRLADAPYELTVTIQGNVVGGYGEGLTVPEWWTRKFARQRQVNELCEQVAGFGLMALILALLVVFVRAIARGDVRWRRAAPWVWPLTFGLVTLALRLNAVPSALFDYETTQNWSAFLAEYALGSLRDALLAAGGAWLLLVVVDPVYRAGFPGAPALERILGPEALRRPSTVTALGVGIVAAVVSLAYVATFYVVSNHFGAWCPVDIDASKTLSGWLPWVESLNVGLSAAFDEELLFRVVAILLIWRVVRVRWIAVVLAAALWAFLHSGYPQLPGYIRGVELTVVGVAWGALFLRYGLVATLTAHYLYNCWLGSFVVFASGSLSNQIGAVAVSVWPIALWLWLVRRRSGEFAESAPDPAAPAAVTSGFVPSVSLPPFRPGVRFLALLLAALALALVAATWIPQRQAAFRELGTLDLSRAAIAERADEILRSRGRDPAEFRRVITSSSGYVPSPDYLLTFGSLDRLAQLFRANWPDVTWRVRYFRVLDPEEFSLTLDKTGRLVEWRHERPHEAPGARLDRAAALAIAEKSLRDDHGVDLARESLVNDELIPQANRRDYRFVFERRNLGWGEARLRTAITVRGDEPGEFHRSVRVPESWSRENRKSGWRKLLTGELKTWTSLLLGVALLAGAVLLIRRRAIPWRAAFAAALYQPILFLVARLNHLPTFFSGYSTTEPLGHFLFTKLGGDAAGLVFGYLGAVLQIGVTLGLVRWAFGLSPAGLLAGFSGDDRRSDRRKTFLAAAAGALAFTVFDLLRRIAAGYVLPAHAAHFSSWTPEEFVPWLGIVTAAFQAGVSGLLRVAAFAAIIALVSRRLPRGVWALVFAYPLLGASGQRDWAEFWFALVFDELALGLMLALTLGLWRASAAAIFGAYFFWSFFFQLNLLWTKGGPANQWQILPPLLLVAAAGAFWALRPRRNRPAH